MVLKRGEGHHHKHWRMARLRWWCKRRAPRYGSETVHNPYRRVDEGGSTRPRPWSHGAPPVLVNPLSLLNYFPVTRCTARHPWVPYTLQSAQPFSHPQAALPL